jgi:RNA-directed DNA polymerase
MVVLCVRDTDKPLSMGKHVLERLGLTLNEAKTNIVHAWDASFDFLGFEIWMQRSMVSGKSYPHVQPGKKAVARIRVETTDLTRRVLTPMPLPMLMELLNQTLRG